MRAQIEDMKEELEELFENEAVLRGEADDELRKVRCAAPDPQPAASLAHGAACQCGTPRQNRSAPGCAGVVTCA